MALKKTITVNDTQYEDAYIVFDSLHFTGKDVAGNRSVHGVLHAKRRKGDDAIICYYDCDFTYDLMSNANLWEQGYAAAKEIEELQGAADAS